MEIRYRYVGFGAVFVPGHGSRRPDQGRIDPRCLYANELAVDVGGICWGFGSETLSVLDHHFSRSGQFPSASAAVLHNRERIRERFANRGDTTDSVLWLVTHQQPDFDAFCAMYLARLTIEEAQSTPQGEIPGLHPDGWLDLPGDGADKPATLRFNWFGPDVQHVPSFLRVQVLLAAYASCVDNGRRLLCPQHRALHSFLYAALKRGRNYLDEGNGALEFFREVRQELDVNGLNPLFDAVLDRSSIFAPERALLDQEGERYQRDIRRARMALVHLQKTGSFSEFYKDRQTKPLLNPDHSVAAVHFNQSGQAREQADAIYLRDPECLLFKEWARLDLENSSLGEGFAFTFIAYSKGRAGGVVNETDYFAAIDPEKARGRHLYELWALLQAAEVNTLCSDRFLELRSKLESAEREASQTSRRTNCRSGYEARADDHKALFDDPWFDGANYSGTILATPNRGSAIAPAGIRSDLRDDPVAAIAQAALEHCIFASPLTIVDLSTSLQLERRSSHQLAIASASTAIPALASGAFRYGRVELDGDVHLVSDRLADQIGRVLWSALNPDNLDGVPADFHGRHLFRRSEWLAVWSRRGIMVACKPAARDTADSLVRQFEKLITLVHQAHECIHGSPTDPDFLATTERLLRDTAVLKHELALPERRILSQFFEATRLDQVFETLYSAAQARATGDSTAIVAQVQTKVEWLEIFFVSFYATELAHLLAELLGLSHEQAMYAMLMAATVFTVAATWALQPWGHRSPKRLWVILALLGLMWLTAIVMMMRSSGAVH